jgi:SAM-dependent MidA family methyltransferase
MTRDPLGRSGDFITAPEVSQMFGELVGVWCASVWRQIGSPENVRLVELGPGRGTMMVDMLRAARVLPEFRNAVVVHMIETSPALQARQKQTLGGIDVPIHWHDSFDDVPEGTLIVVANEFFDALPVHQAVKQINGWYERTVELDLYGNFAFGIGNDSLPLFEQLLPKHIRDAPIGSIFEWRSDRLALEIGRRIMPHGQQSGAALVIDYGHVESAVGDTLQAVGSHAFAGTLTAPGMVDLTAHVDFAALSLSIESMGARTHGPVEQGRFLRALGLANRAAALKAHAPPDKAHDIDLAVQRLTGEGRTGMGKLFKVAAFADPKIGLLPGF